MGRIDTTNVNDSNKMYSAIGTKMNDSSEAIDDLVQNGYFGTVGELITDDVYEFLPPTEGKDIFVMVTPEVDPDEDKVENNSLTGFTMTLGQIGDIRQIKTHDKLSVEEALIENYPSAGAKKGDYVYVDVDKRLLQYNGTSAPTGKLLVGKVESVTNATQPIAYTSGTATSRSLNALGLSYKLVKIRFI